MRFILIDPLEWDYDVASPEHSPMGGSQSALCYLSQNLARHGHEVAVLCGIQQPRMVHGVRCYPATRVPVTLFTEPADAAIVLNGPVQVGCQLRPQLCPATPLVLWTQHDVHQPAMAGLQHLEIRQSWDQVVCVSDWQRTAMLQTFPLEPERVQVLRNAIAPGFERMFSAPDDLVAAKAGRCVMTYTSTPYRGLEELLNLFPTIHREFPETELHVYSSLQVYQIAAERDKYQALYAQCRTQPGVRYFGSVPQLELAQALRQVAILSYPNTFAETSCIAVMEALAAGAYVLTSRLGALPETSLGFGELIPFKDDRLSYRTAYLEALRTVLTRRQHDPAAFSRERFEQCRQINASTTWDHRAREWKQACIRWTARRRMATSDK